VRPFFFWSDYGDSLFLALKLQAEGADVTFHTEQEEARWVGKGLIPLIAEAKIPRGAIVIFDAVKFGKRGQQLRMLGHPVIGGNPFDEQLEVDRSAGARIMLEAGITIPESHPFEAVKDAIDFLEEQDGKWYMKLSGDFGTNQTANGTPDLMIRYLTWWQSQTGKKPPFELQRAVEGTEVSCEGWFDGKRFVPPFNATIEDKKFMTGNRGPRTGCEANMVWALEGKVPALPIAGIVRIAALLRQKKYVGPIDLNCIVTASGEPFGLEWSARLGFDASVAWAKLFKGTLAQQLEAFAHGELEEWEMSDEVAMTLRISTPPYPLEDPHADVATKYRGMPLDPTVLHDDRITLTDVMLDTERNPVMAGRDGHLGTVGQVGYDLGRLRREILEIADGLEIPSLQYRIDPVKRAEESLEVLQGHGYLSHTMLARALEEQRTDSEDPATLDS
jgi:phosphoribosylamine--glycine ligase